MFWRSDTCAGTAGGAIGPGKVVGGGIAAALSSRSLLKDSLRRRGECPWASISASSTFRVDDTLYDGCGGWYHIPGLGQAIPDVSKISV